MNKRHGLWLLLILGTLLLVGAALTSCAPDTSAPERQVHVAQPGDSGDQSADTTVSNTGTGAVEPVEFTDTACLDCHTDEGRLKELAVEEVAAESLSSGPG
jgi:hypothetical protein